MSDNNPIENNAQTIQSHLQIMQSVIQRMASNSASCKAWCITLVSAILVLIIDKEKPEYLLICYIPILLFFFLDTYYLSLEYRFRESYNFFVKKFHENKVTVDDVFVVSPRGNAIISFFKKTISFSIWPFYLTLVVIVFIVLQLIY